MTCHAANNDGIAYIVLVQPEILPTRATIRLAANTGCTCTCGTAVSAIDHMRAAPGWTNNK